MERALRTERVALFVIAALFVASFARTEAYAFVWDDVAEIQHNPLLTGPLLTGLTASQHEHMGVHTADWVRPAHDSYRPLRYLSYRIDVAWFGISARAMHLHSVLLGLVGLACAYFFVWAWGLGPTARWLSVALLAFHPLAVEPVAYVSARSDLLAAALSLLAAGAILRFLRGGSKALLTIGLVCFGLSLASKEAYVLVPLSLAAWAHDQRMLRRFLVPAALLVLVAAAWWAVRAQFARSSGQGQALEALGLLGPVFVQYGRAVLAPFDCSVARPVAAPSFLITALVLCGYALLLLLALMRRPPIASCLFAPAMWFAVTLGPSVVAASVTGVASDRYAYLSLLAFALFLQPAAAAMRMLSPIARATLIAFASLWATAMLYVHVEQVATWRDARTMYEHATAMSPSSPGAWYGLGYTLAEEAGCELAEPIFERVLTLDARHLRALNNLAVCRMRRGALDDAEQLLMRALEVSEKLHPRAWLNLAEVHAAQGRRVEACKEAGAALAIDPGYANARKLAAVVCAPSAR